MTTIKYRHLVSSFAVVGYVIIAGVAAWALIVTPYTQDGQWLLGKLLIFLSMILAFFLFISFMRSNPNITQENRRVLTWTLTGIAFLALTITVVMYYCMLSVQK